MSRDEDWSKHRKLEINGKHYNIVSVQSAGETEENHEMFSQDCLDHRNASRREEDNLIITNLENTGITSHREM
jgi:hypothetical protein